MTRVSIALPGAKEHQETYSSSQFDLELNVDNFNEKLTPVRAKEPARRGELIHPKIISSVGVTPFLSHCLTLQKSQKAQPFLKITLQTELASYHDLDSLFICLGIKSSIIWQHQAYRLQVQACFLSALTAGKNISCAPSPVPNIFHKQARQNARHNHGSLVA